MTDINYTHIAFLLDRSGSMMSIKADTEGGFDAYIESQKTQSGRCTVTLAQFDDEYEEVYAGLDLQAVPQLDLQPRGTTALNDSIAALIRSTGEFLAALPEDRRPGSVIFGIMTDGMENASKEWTRPAIKVLIEEQEKTYDWTFSYMGANQDAVEVGGSMGIPEGRSLTYGTGEGNVQAAMAVYGSSSALLRESVAMGMAPADARDHIAYSPEQRADADPDSALVNRPKRRGRAGR